MQSRSFELRQEAEQLVLALLRVMEESARPLWEKGAAGLPHYLPIPMPTAVYLWDDYFVRVLGINRHARGWQVQFYVIGRSRFTTAGLSEFMAFAQLQPRY